MSLPPILQTALSAAIDGAIIEVFAEKATDKAISILKNHFLSAAEINHALQDSYALALATISAGLAAADQKKAFLQKLTQSKLKREFADQIETHYLPSFQTLQPANFNLPAFRADAVKQCKALIPHQKQLFTAESEFTDADLAAIISYKGSLAITDNILKQLSPLTEVDDTLSTFLSHQELLGNAILFFFTEQLRRHPRVKDTFAALQRAGLWVDVRDLKAAQQKLQKTLEQQQTEIGQQLTEQKQLMADAMATNQFSLTVEIGQTLQQLQQQADAIENNLQQLPKQLQQAQAVWQQSYQQLSQLTEQFQTWLPLIDEKLADVLTGVEELMPLVKGMDDKLDKIIGQMDQIGLSPQIDILHEFVNYDSSRLLKIQDDLAIIKQQLIASPQYQSQVALIEGSIYSSQGNLQAAKQQFIQAKNQAPTNEKLALACFNLFQVYLRDKDYPNALAELQQAYTLNTWQYALHDVDKYPLIKILGAGGMGCVFLCHDQWGKSTVAVKTFWEGRKGRRDEVFKEPIIMSQLDSTYMPKPLDCSFVDAVKQERPYFVTEYVEGAQDAESWIKQQGALPLVSGLKVALQVAHGLAVAHSAGICHLDLKPANLLFKPVEDELMVKIIDFGLARVATSLKQQAALTQTRSQKTQFAQAVFGTLDYAPPEQLGQTDYGQPSAKSDIYAFGATLYHLLSGESPRFPHLDEELPDVPELHRLILACLKHRPEKRPKTQVLITQLSALLTKLSGDKKPGLFAKLGLSTATTDESVKQAEAEEQKKGQLFSFEVISVNANGKEIQRKPKSARCQTIDIGNGVTLDMVYIPGDTFMMGSPETEAERYDDEQQHQVTIEPFYMAKYLVTQAQWQAVMGNNPSRFNGDQRPVEKVSWNESVEFCQRLSEITGDTYRLPSEAQWEYACRAGTTTPFYFGPTITTDLANYDGDYSYGSAPTGVYRGETTDVGSFPPNAFGLYDMHGNLREWCADTWHDNYKGAPTDGSVWEEGGDAGLFVVRSGSWYNDAWWTRSAFRNGRWPAGRNDFVGFRLVQSS